MHRKEGVSSAGRTERERGDVEKPLAREARVSACPRCAKLRASNESSPIMGFEWFAGGGTTTGAGGGADSVFAATGAGQPFDDGFGAARYCC